MLLLISCIELFEFPANVWIIIIIIIIIIIMTIIEFI